MTKLRQQIIVHNVDGIIEELKKAGCGYEPERKHLARGLAGVQESTSRLLVVLQHNNGTRLAVCSCTSLPYSPQMSYRFGRSPVWNTNG